MKIKLIVGRGGLAARQKVFVEKVKEAFPDAIIDPRLYRPISDWLITYVDKGDLSTALSKDRQLPPTAEAACQQALANCPEKMVVALSPSRISFDLAVETTKGQTYFFEFHEEQHRKLTVKRPAVVYNAADNSPVTVPRSLQRLIRDVWRIKTAPNYTIVWYDWFEQNLNVFTPKLLNGFHEFALPGQFTFNHFLGGESSPLAEKRIGA